MGNPLSNHKIKREPGEPTPVDTPILRQQYENDVRALANKAEDMKYKGMSDEQIARVLHAERRQLGVEYKDLTSPDILEGIYQRNLKIYGDKLGPSIEQLIKDGKSWQDIIESSSRPGGSGVKFKK